MVIVSFKNAYNEIFLSRAKDVMNEAWVTWTYNLGDKPNTKHLKMLGDHCSHTSVTLLQIGKMHAL